MQIVIAHQGKKPSTVIGSLSKNLRRTLYERLAGAGVIRAEQGSTLGLFPTRRWPAQDTGHEGQVRQLVTQALVQQGAPDARSAALIALLHALRCEHKIIDPRHYGLSKRQLRARTEEIARGNWASEAVQEIIAAWPPPAPPRPRPPARPSITGITTPERDSRTICLRARAKMAPPGCRVMRLGCAVFIVRATGTCWHAAGLRRRVQQNPVTRAAPGAGTVNSTGCSVPAHPGHPPAASGGCPPPTGGPGRRGRGGPPSRCRSGD